MIKRLLNIICIAVVLSFTASVYPQINPSASELEQKEKLMKKHMIDESISKIRDCYANQYYDKVIEECNNLEKIDAGNQVAVYYRQKSEERLKDYTEQLKDSQKTGKPMPQASILDQQTNQTDSLTSPGMAAESSRKHKDIFGETVTSSAQQNTDKPKSSSLFPEPTPAPPEPHFLASPKGKIILGGGLGLTLIIIVFTILSSRKKRERMILEYAKAQTQKKVAEERAKIAKQKVNEEISFISEEMEEKSPEEKPAIQETEQKPAQGPSGALDMGGFTGLFEEEKKIQEKPAESAEQKIEQPLPQNIQPAAPALINPMAPADEDEKIVIPSFSFDESSSKKEEAPLKNIEFETGIGNSLDFGNIKDDSVIDMKGASIKNLDFLSVDTEEKTSASEPQEKKMSIGAPIKPISSDSLVIPKVSISETRPDENIIIIEDEPVNITDKGSDQESIQIPIEQPEEVKIDNLLFDNTSSESAPEEIKLDFSDLSAPQAFDFPLDQQKDASPVTEEKTLMVFDNQTPEEHSSSMPIDFSSIHVQEQPKQEPQMPSLSIHENLSLPEDSSADDSAISNSISLDDFLFDSTSDSVDSSVSPKNPASLDLGLPDLTSHFGTEFGVENDETMVGSLPELPGDITGSGFSGNATEEKTLASGIIPIDEHPVPPPQKPQTKAGGLKPIGTNLSDAVLDSTAVLDDIKLNIPKRPKQPAAEQRDILEFVPGMNLDLDTDSTIGFSPDKGSYIAPEVQKIPEILSESAEQKTIDAESTVMFTKEIDKPDTAEEKNITEVENEKRVPLPSEKDKSRDRNEILFNEQLKKGLTAFNKKDWKKAVHYLTIAAAIKPTDPDLKDKLRIARDNRKKME